MYKVHKLHLAHSDLIFVVLNSVTATWTNEQRCTCNSILCNRECACTCTARTCTVHSGALRTGTSHAAHNVLNKWRLCKLVHVWSRAHLAQPSFPHNESRARFACLCDSTGRGWTRSLDEIRVDTLLSRQRGHATLSKWSYKVTVLGEVLKTFPGIQISGETKRRATLEKQKWTHYSLKSN